MCDNLRLGLLAGVSLAAIASGGSRSAYAQDATWNLNGTGVWNTAANWTPSTVPTGVAHFGASNQTSIGFSTATTSVGTLQFDAGAPAYSITVNYSGGLPDVVNITGAGIVNNSGTRQIIGVIGFGVGGFPALNFRNASTAADSMLYSSANFGSSGGIGGAYFTKGSVTSSGFQFFDTSTAGSAQIEITGGMLRFNGSSTAGSATVTHSLSGATIFTDNSTAGTATVKVDSGGAITFVDSSSALSAHISSTIDEAFFGTDGGAITFLNNSTAADAVISVRGGWLNRLAPFSYDLGFGGLGFFGTSTAANSTITNHATGVAIFGEQSTAGTASITNYGRLSFNDTATASTSTINNESGGRLYFTNTGAPTATIVNKSGAVIDLSRGSGTVTIGRLSGGGNINLGERNLTLTGLSGNTLISGIISDGGEFGDALTDPHGSLTWNGASLLTLTGNNTFIGLTTIGGGGLQIGDGGATGALAGDIALNAALTINRTGTLLLAGDFSGTATLTQNGTVTTTLSGDGTAFSGPAVINGGAMRVNGNFGSSSFTVNSTATLGGIGTVGITTVNAGGKLAPGNSIGTINAGNTTFASGSTFEVEVDPSHADKLVVTGTVKIESGVTLAARQLTAVGWALSQDYVVIDNDAADAVDGAFSTVIDDYAFLDASVVYNGGTGNDVVLTLSRNTVDFASMAQTPNQVAAAAGAESLGPGADVYDAILPLTPDQSRIAFDQLSGEIHASSKTVMIEDSRFLREAALDRLRQALAAGSGSDSAVWGRAFGSAGRIDSDGNAAMLDRTIGGFFAGGDATVLDTWRVGVVAGHSSTGTDVNDRSSSGSSDNYHLGLYGGTAWGDLAFNTGAAYTWSRLSLNRTPTFPGFSDTLSGEYSAGTAQVFGELAYGIDAGQAQFEPFVNLAFVNVHTDRFTETGGSAALTAEAFDVNATFTTLGLRASTRFDLNGMPVTAKGSVGWRHALGDLTPDAVLRFASGGDRFTVAGVPIAADAMVLDLGVDVELAPDATLAFSYGGQLAAGFVDQSLRASLNVKF